MRVLCAFSGLFLALAIANCSPVVKREAEEDLSPLNEVIEVIETDDAADGERGDRDKRKIGVTLGISNGIINFVFDKVDSFIDSKTKALTVLDESNKVKNAAFGIDNKHSATSEFLGRLVSQKIKAATGSIGPIINSATTLFSGASAGISKALASKIGSLSSVSGGLSGGLSGGGAGGDSGHADGNGGSSGSALIGNLLSQKIGSLSSLSQSSGGLGSLSGGSGNTGSDSHSGSNNGGAGASAGINLGAFANLAGKTTTEETPVFDRTKVSLDIPSSAFGSGFTIVNSISKVLSGVILNSARRTETLLEIFKPFFRGTFAIKGLPSDNPK